jgi:hypothetical protein
MSPADDAQRELERRALRNVRGLVEKLEDSDQADARTQRRLLVAIVIVAVLLALVTAFMLSVGEDRAKPVAIDPSKLPPVRAGPPR